MNARLVAAALLCLGFAPAAMRAQNCEALAKLNTPNVIATAATHASGLFTQDGKAHVLADVPPFCRVAVNLKPTADSDIHAEVWLPASRWNGKLMAVGSGGWGGSLAYDAMAGALRRGYATVASDDGHTGPSGSFVMGHPEKLIDFAYRADHEMIVEAKFLIQAFYGKSPQHSYWVGCSGGGREGLIQAARYPDELDGVIAGDPANIRRNAWALWLATESFRDPESYIPPEKYPMIHRFVLDACDANDGVQDGLIENPLSCHPDFAKLACKAAEGADCLTQKQAEMAQTIISPATGTSGKVLFPRLEPGTELRWGRLAGGPSPADLFLDEFRYAVYQNPDWDWRSFSLDRDAAKAHAVDKDVDEMDPHLAAFVKHGGKLLLYHGWADQQVAPGSSIDFYQQAVSLGGVQANTQNWIRLFMAPGMGHCSGGEGPDTFDKINVLESWVEQGKAPEQIVASHRAGGHVDRTRPLCAYPKAAQYRGSGSIDEAANFTCAMPK
jgi:feruloyl esterase